MTEQRRFPKSFVWTALIAIAVCVLGYLVYREQHGAARLKVIRAAIAESADHVQSLEGKYSSSNVYKSTGVPGSGREQKAEIEHEFAADLKKSRMAVESRELVKFADMPGITFRFRRDERHGDGAGYNLVNSRRDPQSEDDDWGEPHILIISPRESGRRDLCDLAGLGTARNGAGGGLIRLLADGDTYGSVHYEGMEKVNGALCERITISIDTIDSTIWLDPAHDYLPRKQKLRGSAIDVFEFQQYRDESSGGLCWFPSRGAINMGGDHQSEFAVSELTINPTFEANRFRIDPESLPDGVKVRNDLKGGKWTYTGGREDLWKERDDAWEEGMRILRKNGPPK